MTAVLTEPLTRPVLRLVPAPLSAPPFDDEPGVAPVLRLVPPLSPPPRAVPFDAQAWLASERTPTSDLPDVAVMARLLVRALLEVTAGVRPIQQLRRDTTPEVYVALRHRLGVGRRPVGARPDQGAIRSLHVQQRPEGVAEVSATIRQGPRYGAIALRLEGVDGHWRCTDLAGF
jgi:hypothetical protein